MRYKLLLLVATALLTTGAFAQNNDNSEPPPSGEYGIDPNIRFGAFLAPNISWMHPTTSKSDDGRYYVSSKGSRVGFSWGLTGEHYFAPNYGVVFGFNLTSTGGKMATSVNSNDVDTTASNTVLRTRFTYRLQYLEIPVALKLRSDEISNGMRFFGQIGLSLCINTSHKVNYNVDYTNVYGIPSSTSGDNEKLQGSLAVAPILLQMNIGAGIEYPVSDKISFFTGLFFSNAFLPDVTNPKNYDMDYTGNFSDGNTRLNNISLRVGLFF